jgi:hypothetical protein
MDTVREEIRVQPKYIGGNQLTARHGSVGEKRGDYIVYVRCCKTMRPFGCYRGLSGQGVRLTIHPPYSARVKNNRAMPVLPPRAFITWTQPSLPFCNYPQRLHPIRKNYLYSFVLKYAAHTESSEQFLLLVQTEYRCVN